MQCRSSKVILREIESVSRMWHLLTHRRTVRMTTQQLTITKYTLSLKQVAPLSSTILRIKVAKVIGVWASMTTVV